ncbi:MAG: ATP-binding cassette domain-containing protein, partial [bacterium]
MNTKLELKNVSREVNGKILLDKISLAVPEGTVAAIIGPSGAGKSTLLSLINRLKDPTAGTIYL